MDALERQLYDEVRVYACSDACPGSWRVGFRSGVPADEDSHECPECGVPGYDWNAARAAGEPSGG